MKYNLSEIFYSLQGEGPMSGRPSIFVRFSGCNLRCRWGDALCDTPYTSWNPETNLVELEQLIAKIRDCEPSCNNLVLTGGEPLIQPGFDQLCRELKQQGYSLDLETNGTAAIPKEIDLIVCSPKISDSVPHGDSSAESHQRIRTRFFEHVNGEDPRLFLKFVVSAQSDLEEIQEIVAKLGCPAGRVYLMPEGITPEQIAQRSPAVAALAAKLGYNFTTRLHILLWGNKRGV